MLHIADKNYYDEINAQLDTNYDVILYELITNKQYVENDDDNNKYKKRLINKLYSKDSEKIAKEFDLKNQLNSLYNENYVKNNW
jgi:hypothetical protein